MVLIKMKQKNNKEFRRKIMKIVAISGVEIGRPGYSIETEEIDREIMRLSGKKHPKVLFIPTASGDSPALL